MKDELFEKSIRTLELPKVLEMLAHEAVTDEGKERCRNLRPFTDVTRSAGLLARHPPPWTWSRCGGPPAFPGCGR